MVAFFQFKWNRILCLSFKIEDVERKTEGMETNIQKQLETKEGGYLDPAIRVRKDPRTLTSIRR